MNGHCAIKHLLAGAAILFFAVPAPAQETDPSVAAQPQFDFADQPVAVIIRATLTDIVPAQLDGVEVSNVPAPSYIADPPLLQIAYFTSDDGLLGLNNTWDPRWIFQETDTGGEQQQIETPADGVFLIPLTRDLARVIITDLATDEVLLDVDVSAEVQGFCTEDPDSESCKSTIFEDRFE